MSRLGIQASGPSEQFHVRPWSTLYRIPTQEGMLYFKASAPFFSGHETALTAALSTWYPKSIPHVLVADLQRSWMLMADGGTRMRSVLQEDKDIQHWHRVVTRYARMQSDAVFRTPIREMGLPDRRLATLPTQYVNLLADTEVLRIGHSEGLSTEEYQRLRTFTPELVTLCERLAAYGIPETLQHDDLHDGNILVQGDQYIIFDWGDSCISHPFFSMLVVLRSAAHTLELKEDDPALLKLRDLYLNTWISRLSWRPHANLRAAFSLAYHLGMICRALTWYRLASGLEGALKEQAAGSVSGWLQEFLSANPGDA